MTPRTSLVLAAALVVASPAGAFAAGPGTGDAIRSGLPQPGTLRPQAGTIQLAGQDAGKRFNVAVVRSGTGAVLAYVCDGERVGRWFTGLVTGRRAVLTGRSGARLTVVFSGTTRAAGTAAFGSTRIRFTLPRARTSLGLRRTTARANGRTFEAAWIVTNGIVTRGLASEDGGKTVATSSSSTNPATDADAGVTASPGAGTSTPTPTILRKFRCNRLALQLSSLRAELRDDNISQAEFDEGYNATLDRYKELNCSDFFA